MEKVLVVGCGGSGAKTLAYMMDQLKMTLAEKLPDRYDSPKDVVLPKAWQFVAVDVPTVPESPGANLPNVPEAGGRYISCGSAARYSTVDTAVSNQLGARRELGTLSSWALPNPQSETTPVSSGAGQYRAIGRMLILSKLQEVQRELRKSWEVLYSADTDRELANLRSAIYDRPSSASDSAKGQPLILVVSSMAGGAGASMALDICRLVSNLEGSAVGQSALFAVTPDIFSQLSEDAVAGTNPNALAMFAELVAAQLGSATEEDRRLFSALGVPVGDESIPIGRIFPVGVRSGENGALLGDGKPNTVYRALGRGLAALMADEGSMENFRSYTLGNPGRATAKEDKFAWGAQKSQNVPWGSYGYAQLSMGRDRYAEYAAQRLARTVVDKLLRGHYDPTDDSSADVQIRKRLDRNAGNINASMGRFLPQQGQASPWIYENFRAMIETWAQKVQSELLRQIPDAQNRRGSEWVLDINTVLREFSQQVDRGKDEQVNRTELYNGVSAWAAVDGIQEGLLELLRSEIAKYGVPYGSALLRQIRQQIESVVAPELNSLYTGRAPQAVVLDEQVRRDLEGSRGRIEDSSRLSGDIVTRSGAQVRTRAIGFIAHRMSSVLDDFVRNFIAPLERTIQREHLDLEKFSELTTDSSLGVAQLKTNVPALWPDESQNEVPKRFSQAANEVFLTEVDTFVNQFVSDIIQSARTQDDQDLDYSAALRDSAERVAGGEWESLSGSENAPRDLIRQVEIWVARDLVLGTDVPGNAADPRSARFAFNISSEAILERARQYIRRPGFSFQQFISSSLRHFVTAPDLSEDERRSRRQQVRSKFSEAMTYALPLAQINSQLVQEIYENEVRYNFNFSRIPFGGDELGGMLEDEVLNYPNNYTPDQTKPLGNALVNQGDDRAIDIFGSYPNYAPIVFDSLLPPIEKQWRQTTGTRAEFWQGRRARPLAAALPMSDAERQAMVLGWYIGRLTGTVFFPGTLDTSDNVPVQIYDPQANRWVNFDTPMLTPVSRFRATLDWLPNLLESVSLAWARAGEQPLFESVKPYLLLRELWDDEPSPSRPGRTTRGQRLLHEWLYNGERQSGEVHMVEGTGPEALPEQRLAAAKSFLERQNQIAQEYVPTSKLEAGKLFTTQDRPYADITDRSLASQVPLFADIAPDVVSATSKLAGILEDCLRMGPPQAAPTGMPTPGFHPGGGATGGTSLPGAGEF